MCLWMDIRKLFGRNLARLRAEADLTQERLSELSGVSQQYLSEVERGKRNPGILTVSRIAQALNVSHLALLASDGHDDAAPSSPAGSAPPDQGDTRL